MKKTTKRSPAYPGSNPSGNTKREMIFLVFWLCLIFCVPGLIYYFLYVKEYPIGLSQSMQTIAPPYSIERPRMAVCPRAGDDVCSLNGTSIFPFAARETICAAWTEVSRKTGQSLNVFIYDQNKSQIFSVSPIVEPDTTTRQCRYLKISPESIKSTGSFQTTFILDGRSYIPFLVNWGIVP